MQHELRPTIDRRIFLQHVIAESYPTHLDRL